MFYFLKRPRFSIYRSEETTEQPREKQAPQFTVKPRDLQSVENEPARFECAVIGNPKPKVIWYINGNQAIHVLFQTARSTSFLHFLSQFFYCSVYSFLESFYSRVVVIS